MSATRYVRLVVFTGDEWIRCPHCGQRNVTPMRHAECVEDDLWREDHKAWCPDCDLIWSMGELADKISEIKEARSGDNDPLYTK